MVLLQNYIKLKMKVNRNNQRMKSLDYNLPKIKEEQHNQDLNSLIEDPNKKLKLPLLGNHSNVQGLKIYDSKNKLNQNIKYKMQSRNKYKSISNEYKSIHKSYLSNENAKLPSKLKMQNIGKTGKRDQSPIKSNV